MEARPTALLHVPGDGWLCFESPRRVLAAARVGEVQDVLEELRLALASGLWAAGFLAYEATPAFDPAFAAHEALAGVPVAWWGLFEAPRELVELPPADGPAPELQWTPQVDRQQHAAAVAEVRRLIAAGDTYQVNLTFPLVARLDTRFDAVRDPYRLFHHWLQPQAGVPGPMPPYAAWIDTGADDGEGVAVASASPELFFGLQGDRLWARPMKGTAPRGRWQEEDEARRRELASEKNRAENLMIADMTRNDLGRVAVPGTVRVTELFGVESYGTVHQLTTEVGARLEPGRDAVDVLRALYPCASITGAPKARTSHIIRSLEAHPRGLYTGCAGYLAPDGSAQLSVLIRSALFDRRGGEARFGTGGGVVWDSSADSEYDEARTKARVLDVPAAAVEPDFRLLETMLWRPKSGFFLLARHLDRLMASAAFFGFGADRTAIETELRRRAAGWTERTRVRLLVGRGGGVEIQALAEPCRGSRTVRLALDDRPVDEADVFLCHKTTRRGVYEAAAARHPGSDDVVLWNRRGELTEATRANLVLVLDGRRLTPPRRCGLLAGTYRDQLIADGRLYEQVLTVRDLEAAEKVFLVNSVQGWRRAELPRTRHRKPQEPTAR